MDSASRRVAAGLRRAGPLVFAVVAAAYANTIGDYFVWSDFFQIRDGHMVVKTGADLRALYLPDQLFENNYYRPLQVLSNTLDWHLWGGSARGFHVTSVLLHALNAVLVLFLAHRILAVLRPGKATGLAVVVALVWAIHPFKSESVAWIADRGTLLQAFTLGSLLVGLRYLQEGPSRQGVSRGVPGGTPLVVGLFVLGLLSKEIALVLPLLLLATHGLLDLPWSRRAVFLHANLFGVAASYLVVRRLWLWHPPRLSVEVALPTRLLSQPPVIVDYLSGLLWPLSSTASDVVPLHGHIDAEVLGASALLVALVGLAAWAGVRRRERLWPWIAGWFLVCIAPTSNLLLQRHFRGERYLYLASFALVLGAVVWADRILDWLARRIADKGRRAEFEPARAVSRGPEDGAGPSREVLQGHGDELDVRAGSPRLPAGAPRFAGIALATVVVLALAAVTWIRNSEWSSNDVHNEVFFAREVQRDPRFREALGNLCRGRARQGDYEKALEWCRRGWEIDPTLYSSTAWQPLGFHALMLDIHDAQGDCPAALQLTRDAIVRFPREPEFRRRLQGLRQRCAG